jgi:hypothetical protein
MKEIKEGTVIHGTMRREDLIPAFLEELKSISEEMYDAYLRNYPNYSTDESFMNSEDADCMLQDLFDELDSYAPKGMMFNSHPGDGSDYGFWVDPDYEEGDEHRYDSEWKKD